MNNYVLIGIMSFAALIIVRLIFVGIEWFCTKKSINKDEKFNASLSLGFILLFLVGFCCATLVVLQKKTFNDLEAYVLVICIGIYTILWCYFEWSGGIKQIPRISVDKRMIALKKIFVFSIVMVFSIFMGYLQMKKLIYENDVDIYILLANATLISSMLAFDRVMNQVHVLMTTKNN